MLAALSANQELILFSVLKIAPVVVVLLTMVAYSVWVERKVSAAIQDRTGPNRVGPFGLFQPIADGIKFVLKEDFTPQTVKKAYFWLAPAITMIPAFMVVAVIPFGSWLGAQKMVIADLNVGMLYIFGIVSLGVYGIVLAGYASNSKYPFLGGIRSSAQMISYEISMGLSVVPVFLLVGDLNLTAVVTYQAGSLFDWMLFKQPIAAAIFLISAFAETNRLPFDMPEAETELVGGYHTEYSSMKFALFFLGEYAYMIAASGVMVTLFLGGWSLPFWGLDQPATTLVDGELVSSIWMGFAHIGIFIGKVCFVLLVFIWVRWMWPRFRYDQLMDLGWRRFIPVALANIVLTAVVMWVLS